jgi:hypothetical protein
MPKNFARVLGQPTIPVAAIAVAADHEIVPWYTPPTIRARAELKFSPAAEALDHMLELFQSRISTSLTLELSGGEAVRLERTVRRRYA